MYTAHISSALIRNSTLCFEHGNAIKIWYRIVFNFLLGLTHIKLFSTVSGTPGGRADGRG